MFDRSENHVIGPNGDIQQEVNFSESLRSGHIEFIALPNERYELNWSTEIDATDFADLMSERFSRSTTAMAEYFDYSEQEFFQGEYALEDIRDNRFLDLESGQGTEREFQVGVLNGVSIQETSLQGVAWRRTDVDEYEISAATVEWPPEYGREMLEADPTTDQEFEEAYSEIVASAEIRGV